MNTPTPCDTCVHLYVDAMQKDNPLHTCECSKGNEVKLGGCHDYRCNTMRCSVCDNKWTREQYEAAMVAAYPLGVEDVSDGWCPCCGEDGDCKEVRDG